MSRLAIRILHYLSFEIRSLLIVLLFVAAVAALLAALFGLGRIFYALIENPSVYISGVGLIAAGIVTAVGFGLLIKVIGGKTQQ